MGAIRFPPLPRRRKSSSPHARLSAGNSVWRALSRRGGGGQGKHEPRQPAPRRVPGWVERGVTADSKSRSLGERQHGTRRLKRAHPPVRKSRRKRAPPAGRRPRRQSGLRLRSGTSGRGKAYAPEVDPRVLLSRAVFFGKEFLRRTEPGPAAPPDAPRSWRSSMRVARGVGCQAPNRGYFGGGTPGLRQISRARRSSISL